MWQTTVLIKDDKSTMSRLETLTQSVSSKMLIMRHFHLSVLEKKPNSAWQERDGDQSLFSNSQLLYCSLCNTNPRHKLCTASLNGFVLRGVQLLLLSQLQVTFRLCRTEESAKKAAQITHECSLTSERNCISERKSGKVQVFLLLLYSWYCIIK